MRSTSPSNFLARHPLHEHGYLPRKNDPTMAVEAYASESSVIKDVTRKTGVKKKIKGYLVKMADKKIHFYRADEIIVHPLPDGAVIEKMQRGKKRQMKNTKLA